MSETNGYIAQMLTSSIIKFPPPYVRSSTQEHAGTRKPSYSVGYRNLSIIKAKPQNRCQSRLKNKAHNPKLARWWGCNYSAGGLFWIPSQTWGGLSFRTDGLSIFHVFKQTWTINMFFFLLRTIAVSQHSKDFLCRHGSMMFSFYAVMTSTRYVRFF